MKAKKIITALSIGVTCGVVIGVIECINHIAANQYVQHKMFRLIAFSFQKYLNKWSILSLKWLIIPFFLLLFLYAAKLAWNLYLSNFIKTHTKHQIKKTTVVVCIVCSVFFIFCGWAVNHYWLHLKLNIISRIINRLDDLAILLLAVISWWILLKDRIFEIIETKHINYIFRRTGLAAVIFLVVVNLSVVIDSKMAVPKGPNVIFIVIDTLRRDHVGAYGYKRNTTPNIDSFAKNATLVRNAFAQAPSTKPSIASLFTSKYPSQHNIVYNADSLDLSYTTLAEVLNENKYITAGFIENIVISEDFKYDQGFQIWELDHKRYYGEKGSTEGFDKKIFSWLDKHYKKPFFLYVHYIDPHDPYEAPEPFYNFFDGDFKSKRNMDLHIDGHYDRDKQFFYENKRELEHFISQYDDEIRYIDSRVGELIQKIKQLNIMDESIIVLLSDHGEEFLEHGNLYHSTQVYSELINIPLIIRYPKLFKEGYKEEYMQHIDFFPTITHALNIDAGSLSLEGNNVLSGSNEDIKIFSEHLRKSEGWGNAQRCIIFGDWKLIHNTISNKYSLFNIKDDPSEYKDLVNENTEIADNLKYYMLEWINNLEDRKVSSKIDLDQELMKKLKSLGYIQ